MLMRFLQVQEYRDRLAKDVDAGLLKVPFYVVD